MQPDPHLDYACGMHDCNDCGSSHELRSFPVDDGFVVAVCCRTCRDRTGLPRRYSTETPSFPTFDQAERSRKALIRMGVVCPSPPTRFNPLDFPKEPNIRWDRTKGYWRISVSKGGKKHYAYHKDHAEAIRIRDALREAA